MVKSTAVSSIIAVLIDDERPALRGLEYLLREYDFIEIAGMFTNPLEALEKILEIRPHIVFLDINMPQLQGIDAASKILDQNPDTDIIFVTAYDQFAVEAFELHALDYILKPVSRERFEKTLQRVLGKTGIKQQKTQKKLVIKCFGPFQMGWLDSEPVKWRTEKTRELFAFLLQHQGRQLSKEELLDQLWPEVEPVKAVHQLHNGIYYIRKTLERYGVDRDAISIQGSYSMKLGDVVVDVDLFNQYMCEIENNPTIENLERVMDLYAGEYVEGTDWPWADIDRERYARQHCEAVVSLAGAYIDKEDFSKAEELLLRAFGNNPLEEAITELLMKLYTATNAKVKAVKHFMEYTKILKEELGIKPRQNIEKMYTALRS